jgi:hypothetical protein
LPGKFCVSHALSGGYGKRRRARLPAAVTG